MGLVNDKHYNIYDYKPSNIEDIIIKKHIQYQNSKKNIRYLCPACGSENYNFAFDKMSFHYVECSECMSLYIQNVLNINDTREYNKYLENNIYSKDEYKNYLNIISEKSSFDLEMTFARIFNKKDNLNVAYLGNKSLVYKSVFNKFDANFIEYSDLENLKDREFDLIIVDNYIEKIDDIKLFISNMLSLLKNRGYIYNTVKVGSGIDVITLWEDSKLYPLEHKNLLSIDGLKKLFTIDKLIIREINTPGVLDIENILKVDSKNIPKFLKYLKLQKNTLALEDFQSFIQKHLLSSFATIIVQKG